MRYRTRDQRFKRLVVDELNIPGGSAGKETIGSGDNVTTWATVTAQLLDIRKGTAASPDTTQNPIVKVSRVMQMPFSGLSGAAPDYAAGIVSVVSGTVLNEVQTVGVLGYARSASTVASPAGADDALGVNGVGRVTGSCTGSGIGGAFDGRRDTSTGRATGAEISTSNFSGVAGAYNSTGYSNTTGLWIVPLGDADSGVGVSFGNPYGFQYKVGIGFSGQVTAGLTGSIADSSIRDDCTSAVAHDIRGTHATAAIRVAAGAGASVFPCATGSFEIPTECYSMMSRRLTLTGTQRATMAGTARLRMT